MTSRCGVEPSIFFLDTRRNFLATLLFTFSYIGYISLPYIAPLNGKRRIDAFRHNSIRIYLYFH